MFDFEEMMTPAGRHGRVGAAAVVCVSGPLDLWHDDADHRGIRYGRRRGPARAAGQGPRRVTFRPDGLTPPRGLMPGVTCDLGKEGVLLPAARSHASRAFPPSRPAARTRPFARRPGEGQRSEILPCR